MNNKDDYDPSSDEEFYKNLSKAFEENDDEDDDINLDIDTDEEFQWIDIDAAAAKEPPEEDNHGKESAAPADSIGKPVPPQKEDVQSAQESSELDEEELFANIMKEASAAIDGPGEEDEEDEENGEQAPPVSEEELFTSEEEEYAVQDLEPESDRTAYAGNPDKNEEQARKEEDELLASINASLAAQVSEELDGGEPEEPQPEPPKKKKKLIRILVPVAAVLMTLCCAFGLLIGTKGGRNLLIRLASEYAYSRLNLDKGESVETSEEFDDIDEDESNSGPTPTDTPKENINLDAYNGTARHEEYVVNILLLGEEAIGSGSGRGRTDMMMIASLNMRDQSLKLTSMMRDMLVSIPGYQDNKLNAAYNIGGVPLLLETIELNFDLHVDGYALVNFASFEEIIDELGGVSITLTQTEAAYLNSTNYISDPKNRNTIAGTQMLNGNQALGYCRVRYVPTGDKQHDDYGRTQRQRTVLNAIFEKYKSQNFFDLLMLMNKILPMVTTDIDKEDFTRYLQAMVDLHPTDMEEFRIPVEGAYEGARVRGMAVLVPDLTKNVQALQEFIFGDYEE